MPCSFQEEHHLGNCRASSLQREVLQLHCGAVGVAQSSSLGEDQKRVLQSPAPSQKDSSLYLWEVLLQFSKYLGAYSAESQEGLKQQGSYCFVPPGASAHVSGQQDVVACPPVFQETRQVRNVWISVDQILKSMTELQRRRDKQVKLFHKFLKR